MHQGGYPRAGRYSLGAPYPTCSHFVTCLSPTGTEFETLGLATLGATWGMGGKRGQLPLHSSDLLSLPPFACSFTQAMLSQPRMDSLDNPTAYQVGLVLLGIGSMLVLSSFFALGFTGTFLGKTLRAGGT